MENELEKRIKKLESDFKFEKANIRSNYFLTILILLTYLILEINFKDNEVIFNIIGYNIDKLYLFIIISIGLLIFNIGNIYKYSKEIIKRYIFKINK